MNLPESYLKTMKDMLGDDYDAYLESFNDKRLYGLRVNNLKISTEDFLKISPFKLKPIPWIKMASIMRKTTSLQSIHITTQVCIIYRNQVP